MLLLLGALTFMGGPQLGVKVEIFPIDFQWSDNNDAVLNNLS